jgi:N-acylneuraminate cytidylyltransferase
MQNEHYEPEIIVQLRPTSPLRPSGCVDRAVELLRKKPEADSVRAVTPSGQNPYKMWRIVYGELNPLLSAGIPEPFNAPRQELPPTYWQTGHIDVIRSSVIRNKNSLSGDTILPFLIDSHFVVDLDTPEHWEYAEYLLRRRNLNIAKPEDTRAPALSHIRLVISDFDGVLTDNLVYLTQDGKESVTCSRGDGLGIAFLLEAGIPFVVLSTEVNPVVSRRCEKLNVPCYQGISEKAPALDKIAAEYQVAVSDILFLGNDINDLGALHKAGFAAAPSDARPEVLAEVDLVLKQKGGKGAVREICDLILQAKGA